MNVVETLPSSISILSLANDSYRQNGNSLPSSFDEHSNDTITDIRNNTTLNSNIKTTRRFNKYSISSKQGLLYMKKCRLSSSILRSGRCSKLNNDALARKLRTKHNYIRQQLEKQVRELEFQQNNLLLQVEDLYFYKHQLETKCEQSSSKYEMVSPEEAFKLSTSSIQRYFLLFKIHLLRKRQTRWILHYIPLIFCIIYPPIFYLITIIFYSCTSTDIINSQYCTIPCYFQNSILLIVDCIIHYILPLIITISANIVLICWMIHLRCDLNVEQMYLWKRQKKLISQILIFSLFYIIGWLPSTIVSALNAFSFNKLNQYGSVVVWLNYTSYFICPLQPFICLILVPEPIYFLQDTLRQLLRKAMMRTSVITVEP
ncbi:unnamed protein product [Adineta steineri]|uniref:G-protein coupled receptors family 1 profile domain-containing protein n=1 Tax=Adineta steineri TaxID=433720 RepID=A0A819KIT7_9BILA|nr:unnamed protein product [Adineta steineri]